MADNMKLFMKKFLQVSLIFLFVGCLVSCDFGAKNILIKEILSPVGENKVVIFQRDAGATTGFSVQVSVLKSNQDLKNSEKGNIFVIAGNKTDFESGKLFDISWVDEKTLNITLHSDKKVYKQVEKLENISIQYH